MTPCPMLNAPAKKRSSARDENATPAIAIGLRAAARSPILRHAAVDLRVVAVGAREVAADRHHSSKGAAGRSAHGSIPRVAIWRVDTRGSCKVRSRYRPCRRRGG